MTREEREKAIDVLEHNWTRLVNADYSEEELNEAYSTALKALKQELCEDAISRKAVLKYIEHSCADLEGIYANGQVRKDIKNMPSVTPAKRGSWIERFNEEERWLMCTECRQDSDKAYNFCPNCGAKMEGSKNGA